MKKSFLFVLTSLPLSLGAQQITQLNIENTGSVHELSWEGVQNRHFILGWSTDLQGWALMPEILTGDGSEMNYSMGSTAPKMFFRLDQLDGPQVSDPMEVDFDGDGIVSREELLNDPQTNPFSKDTSGDGNPDGFIDQDGDDLDDRFEMEIVNASFSDSITSIADVLAGDDFDLDGLTNLEESLLATRAYRRDSDGDGYDDFLAVKSQLHLPLDEQVGSLANDISPAQTNGQISGSITWQSQGGVIGGSLDLNNSNSMITIPNSSFDGSGSFTMSVWFRTESASPQTLISGSGAGSPSLAVTLSGGNQFALALTGGSNVSWTYGRSLADNAWHHLVIVRDVIQGRASLYLDGREWGTSQSVSTQNLGISQIQLGSSFQGCLDEIRFFSDKISNQQVSDLFQPNDLDRDGLPDDYELSLTQNLTTLLGADDDLDGDTLTNREEYDQGSDPLDYFNGETPVVELVSGDGQSIFNGDRTPDPLVFRVKKQDGTPYENAPLLMTHLEDVGSIETLNEDFSFVTGTLRTDDEGKVSVYFKAD